MDDDLEKSLTTENTLFYVMGNERYPQRATRIMQHIHAQEGWLGSLYPQLRIGRDHRKRFRPAAFREMGTWPHWWAASSDHIDAIEDALSSGCGFLLVVEDDAHFVPHFDAGMRAAWASLPLDWKALRLGWNATPETGMIATLWSRKGMLEAFPYFIEHRGRVIDRAFADLRRDSPGGWHCTREPLVKTAPGSKQCGWDA